MHFLQRQRMENVRNCHFSFSLTITDTPSCEDKCLLIPPGFVLQLTSCRGWCIWTVCYCVSTAQHSSNYSVSDWIKRNRTSINYKKETEHRYALLRNDRNDKALFCDVKPQRHKKKKIVKNIINWEDSIIFVPTAWHISACESVLSNAKSWLHLMWSTVVYMTRCLVIFSEELSHLKALNIPHCETEYWGHFLQPHWCMDGKT